MTESLQTISLWTECAEESIRTGNLIKWTVKRAFLSLHYKGYIVTFSILFFIKYMKKKICVKNLCKKSDVRSSHIYDICC